MTDGSRVGAFAGVPGVRPGAGTAKAGANVPAVAPFSLFRRSTDPKASPSDMISATHACTEPFFAQLSLLLVPIPERYFVRAGSCPLGVSNPQSY